MGETSNTTAEHRGGKVQTTTAVQTKDRKDIRMALFKSLRILPLMHNWTFWYDKYSPSTNTRLILHDRYIPSTSAESKGYNNNLVQIAEFNTVPVPPQPTPLALSFPHIPRPAGRWLTSDVYRTSGGYGITCLLWWIFRPETQFICLSGGFNHAGRIRGTNMAVPPLPLRPYSPQALGTAVRPWGRFAVGVFGGMVVIVGAWTFRVPREKASEFFGHIVLLMIGESLSETLETRNDPPSHPLVRDCTCMCFNVLALSMG